MLTTAETHSREAEQKEKEAETNLDFQNKVEIKECRIFGFSFGLAAFPLA